MLPDLSLKHILRSLFHTVCKCSPEKGPIRANVARAKSRMSGNLEVIWIASSYRPLQDYDFEGATGQRVGCLVGKGKSADSWVPPVLI